MAQTWTPVTAAGLHPTHVASGDQSNLCPNCAGTAAGYHADAGIRPPGSGVFGHRKAKKNDL